MGKLPWMKGRISISKGHAWDVPRAKSVAAKILEEADQLSRACLLAAASRESGLWLHALSAPSLGRLLDPETFRVSFALRIGAEV